MSFEQFFCPQSVAIVGASQHSGKVGHEILMNMIEAGFPGQIYPVNNKADTIAGLKCYSDLLSIGKTPELVVVVVPPTAVLEVMNQCARIGVKAVIVITAGFKEVGPEGRALEQRLVQIARSANIRVIGPNCLGVIAPANRLNASFGAGLPLSGAIGYISQSGALLAAILDMANANQIGFSKLVSIGNKADVDELDVMMALGADDQTRVIAGYLESITDGNAFVRRAEQISAKKPILLIKAGGTEAGARAASSHTGSLAGGEIAYECVFERAGVIRCESIEQQFNYALAFAYQPLPKGNRVAVITNAGGPGIMAADAIERAGLTFAKLDPRTEQALAEKLPGAANIHNPVDVLGDALAERYEFALATVLADPNVDAGLVILTPQAMTEATKTAEAIVRTTRANSTKPIFACFMGATKVQQAIGLLRSARIPQYSSPNVAVDVIKAMTEYVRWRSRPKRVVKLFPVNRRKVENIVDRYIRRGLREVGEADAKEVLEAYGFVTPKGALATSPEQAASIAEQIGYPVVLKIWSADIVHKSDVGGVKLGLTTAHQVMDAFDLMMYRIPKKAPQAHILGVYVQQQVIAGKEVILGMTRDPRFGPLMMFGMGGIMVEVMKDVSFYLAPLTYEEAKEMLMSTRTYKILQGVRGQEGVDIEALAEALQRLSQLATEFPQIKELDINPFVVGPAGTVPIAVDARISVEKD